MYHLQEYFALKMETSTIEIAAQSLMLGIYGKKVIKEKQLLNGLIK